MSKGFWKDIPFNDKELIALRKQIINLEGQEPKDGFTCDDCKHAPYCLLVFDWYNTNGSCLMEK